MAEVPRRVRACGARWTRCGFFSTWTRTDSIRFAFMEFLSCALLAHLYAFQFPAGPDRPPADIWFERGQRASPMCIYALLLASTGHDCVD